MNINEFNRSWMYYFANKITEINMKKMKEAQVELRESYKRSQNQLSSSHDRERDRILSRGRNDDFSRGSNFEIPYAKRDGTYTTIGEFSSGRDHSNFRSRRDLSPPQDESRQFNRPSPSRRKGPSPIRRRGSPPRRQRDSPPRRRDSPPRSRRNSPPNRRRDSPPNRRRDSPPNRRRSSAGRERCSPTRSRSPLGRKSIMGVRY